MAYLPRPSRGFARSLRLASRFFTSCRGFSSCTPFLRENAGTPEASSPASKSTTTRVRKSFAELPKVWIKADGTAASPLGAWIGGLETSTELVTEDHTVHESDEDASIDASATVEPTLLLPKAKHRRKKVAVIEATEDVPTDLIAGDDDVGLIKPKRTRRKKSVITDDMSVVQDAENVQQEEAEPPKKIKRRVKRVPELVNNVPEEGPHRRPSTPLANEILANLAKFPHCLLLTRVGQFYESYFEQAAEIAQLLNIKLTDKSWGGQRVLMCGFPIMHLDKHLKTLVQGHNRFVAICEEFMRSRILGPKGGFERRVTRIVTPGTLIDESFLNQYENNYLLAINSACNAAESTTPSLQDAKEPLGLAWIDVSTGEFFAKQVPYDSLQDELVRIGPKEVVLDLALADHAEHPIRQAVAEEDYFTSFISTCDQEEGPAVPTTASASSGTDDLSIHLEPSQSLVHLTLTDAEVSAVKLLTAYLHANLLEHMPRLPIPNREATAGRMQIDAHTIKALEIKESLREGGTTGSLLSVIKRTVTSGGARLLTRWLCSPSTSLHEINARQSLVAFFFARPHLSADLIQSLGAIEDASRIIQKFLLGRGDASDLSAISTTIELWTSIKTRVALERKMEEQERDSILADEWTSIDVLISRLDSLRDLSRRIEAAVSRSGTLSEMDLSDTPNTDGDEGTKQLESESPIMPSGWTIRPTFSEELTRLHVHLADCMSRREQLELRLQSTYDVPSLTLRSSPGQGMHVHIARAKRDASKLSNDPLFIPITEGSTVCTFFFQEWSQLGSEIIETSAAIAAAERSAFETLRSDVNAHESEIRRNSRILDELDITLAFASLARELNLTRPSLKEDTTYHVVDGRHPTVELGLLTAGRVFTPNTVTFKADSPLHIITGPNMAGKSTLLRQTALIAILAQTGSFVPAESAEIGIVDKVFSRVGAKDDLFRDRSTFMVEMLETADILRRATPRSLVIMDEVGRGTTVEDGLAIAFAAVHHLLSVNRCRTLFATHFHELADMLGYSEQRCKGQYPFDGVSFFCTNVDETEDGYFAYSHRLRPGVNRNSHGLKVARLAGMPESAVNVAKTALHWLRARKDGTAVEDRTLLQSLGQTLAIERSHTV